MFLLNLITCYIDIHFSSCQGCSFLQIIMSLFCQSHHPKGIFLAHQYQNIDKITIILELASQQPQGSFVLSLFVLQSKQHEVMNDINNLYPLKKRDLHSIVFSPDLLHLKQTVACFHR